MVNATTHGDGLSTSRPSSKEQNWRQFDAGQADSHKKLEDDDEKFQEELRKASLDSLMRRQKEEQQQAEQKAKSLEEVGKGNLDALKPYFPDKHWNKVLITREDMLREQDAIKNEGMRNETSVGLARSDNPEKERADTEKWLKETFQNTRTAAMIVKSTDGKTYIDIMGVSLEEVKAAERLQYEQRRNAEKAAAIAKRISKRITEEHQRISASPGDNDVKPPLPASINTQRETASTQNRTTVAH